MTERIHIDSSEFRATDANDTVKFSTNNQYIKNSPGGGFSAGGYTRVPTLGGFDVAVDHVLAGGFLKFSQPTPATETCYLTIPFDNAVNNILWGPKGSGTPTSFLGAFKSTNTTAYPVPGSTNAVYIRTNHPYKIDGVIAGTCVLYMTASYYSGDIALVYPSNFNTSQAGVYSFGTVPTGVWTSNWSNSPDRTITEAQLSGFYWAALAVYSEKPSVSLDLAITL